MLSRVEYIQFSLEINLFFQRIIKEHMLLIETHLPPVETSLITEANSLKKSMEQLLSETVIIANGNITEISIESNDFVTLFTLPIEEITSVLMGPKINTNITMAELLIEPGTPNCTQWQEKKVDDINKRTLNLLEDIIDYKKKVLGRILDCKLFSTLYPDIIEHLIEEANYFEKILKKLVSRSLTIETLWDELNFWNHIMREHAEYIDIMLDSTGEDLKVLAEKFINKYELLEEDCIKLIEKSIVQKSLKTTEDFHEYKLAVTKRIVKCEIKSKIAPILADHVLREANFYIRLLKYKYNV